MKGVLKTVEGLPMVAGRVALGTTIEITLVLDQPTEADVERLKAGVGRDRYEVSPS